MTSWAHDLPSELLSLVILSKLAAKDRHSFGLVCKSWNAAAAVSPYRHSPCLMFYEKNNREWKFLQYNAIFTMNFDPELYDTRPEIVCSKHGWLLMSYDSFHLSFFDPFNNRNIDLPSIPFPYSKLCFFTPPTSSDCTIFAISRTYIFEPVYSPGVNIGMLKIGEDEWTSHEYMCETQFNLVASNPVLHRGLLYCMDLEGNIGTFDINKPGDPSSWVVYNNCRLPVRLHGNIKQHYLINHHEGGEEILFAVFVAGDENKVSVFKLVEPYMKWKQVEDLGNNNKRLFLSNTSSIIEIDPPLQSMTNNILFPLLHGDYGTYYSLDTRKYYSDEGDFSSKNAYKLAKLPFATWVVPNPTPEPDMIKKS